MSNVPTVVVVGKVGLIGRYDPNHFRILVTLSNVESAKGERELEQDD